MIENMIYYIDDKFLLRIHKSKAGFSASPFYKDNDMIKFRESELKFLEHLKSNVLELIGDELIPIDFSLFGYSTPMLDFGSIYCFVNEEDCRHSIVIGYEEITGCRVNTNEIDIYFALQILLGIVLHYELWINEKWFSKRLPEWCDEAFRPLLKKYN